MATQRSFFLPRAQTLINFTEIHEYMKKFNSWQTKSSWWNELEALQLQMLHFPPLPSLSPQRRCASAWEGKCSRGLVTLAFSPCPGEGHLPQSHAYGTLLLGLDKHAHKYPLKTFLNNRYIFPTGAVLIRVVQKEKVCFLIHRFLCIFFMVSLSEWKKLGKHEM